MSVHNRSRNSKRTRRDIEFELMKAECLYETPKAMDAVREDPDHTDAVITVEGDYFHVSLRPLEPRELRTASRNAGRILSRIIETAQAEGQDIEIIPTPRQAPLFR